MTSRTRLWVLVVSTPVIAFALIGGYLGRVLARDETYQHLRIFNDVVDLVVDNYVEEVDIRQAMRGAMRGMADGLDPDSAYLTADLARLYEQNAPMGPADIGVDLVRQYYLRVVSVRPGSPAAQAGLTTGDYLRAIDNKPTREMPAYEGLRLLHGAEGSTVELLVIRGNAADPHELTLTRSRPAGGDVTSRMADAATGYIKVVDFTTDAPARIRQAAEGLAKQGATRYIIDVRGASRGDLDAGIEAARPFVKSGTLAQKRAKEQKESVEARPGDGTIAAPAVVLVDGGTSGPGETFAAALDANDRATLVGGRTQGRAARQRLVKLPDGSALLLTAQRYLTPGSDEIHERGLAPDVEISQPDVEFGSAPPPGDPILDRALRLLAERKAA